MAEYAPEERHKVIAEFLFGQDSINIKGFAAFLCVREIWSE